MGWRKIQNPEIKGLIGQAFFEVWNGDGQNVFFFFFFSWIKYSFRVVYDATSHLHAKLSRVKKMETCFGGLARSEDLIILQSQNSS